MRCSGGICRKPIGGLNNRCNSRVICSEKFNSYVEKIPRSKEDSKV
jgi:hypothetical protein